MPGFIHAAGIYAGATTYRPTSRMAKNELEMTLKAILWLCSLLDRYFRLQRLDTRIARLSLARLILAQWDQLLMWRCRVSAGAGWLYQHTSLFQLAQYIQHQRFWAIKWQILDFITNYGTGSLSGL